METLNNENSKLITRVLETINISIKAAFDYIQPVPLPAIFSE
jgi:predicted transcriptional regulator